MILDSSLRHSNVLTNHQLHGVCSTYGQLFVVLQLSVSHPEGPEIHLADLKGIANRMLIFLFFFDFGTPHMSILRP